MEEADKPVFEILEKLGINKEDVRLYARADLDLAGNPCDTWVFALSDKLLVVSESGLQEEISFDLARIELFKTRQTVGSAFLQAKIDNTYLDLVRFTNASRHKFEKLLIQLNLLKKGQPVSIEFVNKPHPLLCPKCGLPLQAENVSCPRCLRQKSIMRRVFSLLTSHLGWLSVMLLLMIIAVVLTLVPPYLTKILVDDVLTSRRHVDWLFWLVFALVVNEFLRAQINMVVGTLSASVGTKITCELRNRIFKKLQELTVDYYDQHSTGTLMTRFSSDVEAFQGFVSQAAQGFLLNILLIAGIGIMLFKINSLLAVYVMIPIPFVIMGTMFFWQKVYPKNFKVWDSQSKMSNFLNSVLSGIRLVKAFAQEDREKERFSSMAGNLRDSVREVQMSTSIFNPMMAFLFSLGGLIVWYAGGKTVLAGGGFTLGSLMAFLGYISMFYTPLSNLTLLSNWFSSFTTASHRIFEILDTEPQFKDVPSAIRLPTIKGSIEFDHVTFGYDPYHPILKDVSFKIKEGAMVGIVGKSGSGKTTIVNLICRFYDVQKGTIRIDGFDVRQVSSFDLRRHVGLVLQEPFLFRGTVSENVSYGKPDATLRQIIESAQAANAHEFIIKLPNGYDTRLGERGSGLSGGEKQRIGIARALLCNPPVLILDEATSSVDTESEKKIQDALSVLTRGRTTIAIAHRLSTLRGADIIYVVDDGEIIESGNHEELMERKGAYYNLVIMQTKLTSLEVQEIPE